MKCSYVRILKRLGYVLFGAGTALLGEHIILYGFTEWELFGHETYGLIMILLAFILLTLKERKHYELTIAYGE